MLLSLPLARRGAVRQELAELFAGERAVMIGVGAIEDVVGAGSLAALVRAARSARSALTPTLIILPAARPALLALLTLTALPARRRTVAIALTAGRRGRLIPIGRWRRRLISVIAILILVPVVLALAAIGRGLLALSAIAAPIGGRGLARRGAAAARLGKGDRGNDEGKAGEGEARGCHGAPCRFRR